MNHFKIFSLSAFSIFCSYAMQQPSQTQNSILISLEEPKQSDQAQSFPHHPYPYLIPQEVAEQEDNTVLNVSLKKLYFMILMNNAYKSERCTNPNFHSLLAKAREKKFETRNALETLELTRKEFYGGLLAHVRKADNAPFDPDASSIKVILRGVATQMTFLPSFANPETVGIDKYKELLTINLQTIEQQEGSDGSKAETSRAMTTQLDRLRSIHCITDEYEDILNGRQTGVRYGDDEPADFGCPVS